MNGVTMNNGVAMDSVLVPVAPGVALRVLHSAGPGRPFLLVHGLASNALLWTGVAEHLIAAGHQVAAVDLRGHGESDAPVDGYTTAVAAADLARVCAELGLQEPVVAGQSWGADVVLNFAAQHDGLHAVACLDGGWLQLADRFGTFEECWAALAPPLFIGLQAAELEQRLHEAHPDWPDTGVVGTMGNMRVTEDGTVTPRLDRTHHKSILHSMWEHDAAQFYPQIEVPVLLLPAGDPEGPARRVVEEAFAELPHCRVVWYAGADHDLHAQRPAECALDLQSLA